MLAEKITLEIDDLTTNEQLDFLSIMANMLDETSSNTGQV